MNFNRPLILASNSPRRQQLLKELGLNFAVKTLHTDEHFPDSLAPHLVAKFLAEKKSEGFTAIIEDEIVITADTVVIVDEQILGKPENKTEAKAMLQRLSNKKHQVITGVCIRDKNKMAVFDEATDVYFKQLSNDEITYYIDQYKPFDKAGAYGIQEWIGMIGIEKIEGSYFNVVGLPVQRVYEYLKGFY